MRVPVERQLRETFFTALFALIPLFGLAAPANTAEQAVRELQAAKLMEATLRTHPLGADERQKLEQIYADLSAKFPSDTNIRNAHAEILWEGGKHERAETIWKEAEKQEPGNAAILHNLGNAALAGGETRQAAEYLAKACTAQPANAGYHFELANLLFLFRKELIAPPHASIEAVVDQALKHYAEACRLAPRDIDFARGYAETFYGVPKPDWNAALAAWQHLFEISPQKEFALANLATVHLKLGKKDEARACVAKMQDPAFAARKARLLERIEKE